MSYQERRALVGLFTTLLINGGYLAYMLPRQPIADAYSPEMFRFWGGFFLLLILVSIIVEIIVTIIFSILNTIATREAEPAFSDERDKLITLKATRISFFFFIIGFLLAMVALVLEMPPSAMFLLLMMGGLLSQVADNMAEFWYYRWGV